MRNGPSLRPWFLFAVLLGCGSSPQPDAPAAAVVAPNVHVIPDELAKAATVEPGKLTFPLPQADSLRSLAAGDVVVAGVGDGFLRKVGSVEVRADSIVLDAPQAELTDAIVDGTVDTTLTPDEGLLRPQTSGSGTVTLPTLQFDADGQSLYEEKGFKITLSKAHVALHPSIDFGFKVSGGSVAMVHAVANGDLEAQAALQVTLSGALTKSGSIPIYKAPQPLRFVQFVGPVPIVEVVTISVDAKWEVGADGSVTAESGASYSRTGKFGVTYADKRFSTDGDPGSPTFTAIGPTLDGQANLKARVELVPRVEVKLYGIAGPALTLDPAATFTQSVNGTVGASGCSLSLPYKLDADVSATVSFDASVFGHTILTWQDTLFDVDYPITSGDFATKLGDKNPCADGGTGDGGGGDGGAGKVVPGCAGATYGGHTYSFCESNADWMEARSRCTAAGGDLVSIGDAAENAFVQSHVASMGAPDAGAGQVDGYYIGLTYDPTAKVFHWVDGTAPTYFSWAPGEPTHVYGGTAENCAMTYVDGTWNDVPCAGFPKNGFVCEAN